MSKLNEVQGEVMAMDGELEAANDDPGRTVAELEREAALEHRNFRKGLGERIEQLRVAAGMTQTQLARLTGIPRPNISGILTGRHATSLERIAELAEVLNTTTDFLIRGVEAERRPAGSDALLTGMDADLDPLEHLFVAILRAAGGLSRPARGACVREVLQVLRNHGG